MQSVVHETLARHHSSSLVSEQSYTPTDCFTTLPFPPGAYEHLAVGGWSLSAMPSVFRQAAQIGATYDEHQRHIMQNRHQGLTKTYIFFHHPTCTDSDIVTLRRLHVALDYNYHGMVWLG